MRGGNTTLVVAEKTSKLPVDHRLSLRLYYRAADSILRQARIYRKENNLIDLYVLLLRFSSLVVETVPQHRDYRQYSGREKVDFGKRLLDVLKELETLKPVVQREVSRYNNAYAPTTAPSSNGLSSSNAAMLGASTGRSQSLPIVSAVKDRSQGGNSWAGPADNSFGPYAKKQVCPPAGYSSKRAEFGRQSSIDAGCDPSSVAGNQVAPHSGQKLYGQIYDIRADDFSAMPGAARSQGSNTHGAYNSAANLSSRSSGFSGVSIPSYSSSTPSPDDRMAKLSLSMSTPTSDSLSRHSFLAPSARKATVSSVQNTKVKYPSLVDASPAVIPSLDQNWHRDPPPIEDPVTMPPRKSAAEPNFYSQDDMIKFEEMQSNLVDTTVLLHSQLSRQPSPPPVAAEVKTVPLPQPAPECSPSHEKVCMETTSLSEILNPPPRSEPLRFTEESVESRAPKQLHISIKLMDAFLRVADGNTRGNIETCGVLTGSLKEGVFYVTTLIIPKQEGTSDSCSTVNEEDIFEYQDKHDLFQFGWIHTHPSQSCFMSSIDLHTHYSYQVMLPEAVAIVMAPTDPCRKYGIFRLSDPGGISVIQACDRRGFHAHSKSEIYVDCGHVMLDPKLTCNIVDLR